MDTDSIQNTPVVDDCNCGCKDGVCKCEECTNMACDCADCKAKNTDSIQAVTQEDAEGDAQMAE